MVHTARRGGLTPEHPRLTGLAYTALEDSRPYNHLEDLLFPVSLNVRGRAPWDNLEWDRYNI